MTDNTDQTNDALESELTGEAVKAPEVPEKFKGKSAAEIVAMYASMESELGRKNNEVGQLRALTDRVLGLAQASQASANQPSKKPISTDDLLNDPDKVLTERIRQEADERARVSDQRVMALEANMALQRFESKYPTYQQELTSAGFLDWVQKTQFRQGLAGRAAQGDYAAADELFTLYNDAKPSKTQTQDPNIEAARRASLAKGGGSSVSDTSTSGKKVYKRADLIDMRIKNREEFDRRFESEFLPAYKEGRVK